MLGLIQKNKLNTALFLVFLSVPVLIECFREPALAETKNSSVGTNGPSETKGVEKDYYIGTKSVDGSVRVTVNGFELFKTDMQTESMDQAITPFIKKGKNDVVVEYALGQEASPASGFYVKVDEAVALKSKKENQRKVVLEERSSELDYKTNSLFLEEAAVRVGSVGEGKIKFYEKDGKSKFMYKYIENSAPVPAFIEVKNKGNRLQDVQLFFLSSRGTQKVIYSGVNIESGTTKIDLRKLAVSSGSGSLGSTEFDHVLFMVGTRASDIKIDGIKFSGFPRSVKREFHFDVASIKEYSWSRAEVVQKISDEEVDAIKKKIVALGEAFLKKDVDYVVGEFQETNTDMGIMTGKPKEFWMSSQKKFFQTLLSDPQVEVVCADEKDIFLSAINDRVIEARALESNFPICLCKKVGQKKVVLFKFCMRYIKIGTEWRMAYSQ